ncbi:branched-chain amino acid ABC transporter permease [Desulfurobacterium atlanticum]|uniref:Amino acid/amide ABC transporter membrane protein 2, HAAT family n=1 Tax=Desulfurobacterium atlanticum TaxID=240169 RepID=A0A238Y0X8_9BACT|nr:branched-chain amino acid ABC transporter permease [Desulfurobacterium atlanticum]SNR64956.1 amino acid/amide ABC transporter membrane protein 2, HAAT family [Desulfurobacterium atlanticum]
MKKYFGFILSLIILAGCGVYPLLTGSPMARENMFLLLSYVGLALSLNILMGFTGYVSFGHVVFFGIGGYTTFALIYHYGMNLIPALLIGGLVSALIATLIGLAVLNLRGAYFAIATIGINEAFRALISNVDYLGGAEGLFFNLRKAYSAYGGSQKALWISFILLTVITVMVLIVNFLIKHSKFGLGLFSIREDEDAAKVLGINTALYKTVAFAISAFFPGVIGGLFFFKNGSIDPGSAFHLLKSVEMIFMVMLGGIGTVFGPVIGAITYEQIRAFLLVNPTFKDLHLAISGVVLLLIVLFVPEGIVGFLRKRFKFFREVFE